MTTVGLARRRTAEASALAAVCAAGALLWLTEHEGAALLLALPTLAVAAVARLRPADPVGWPAPVAGTPATQPGPSTDDDPVASAEATPGEEPGHAATVPAAQTDLDPLVHAGRAAEQAVVGCEHGIGAMRGTFDEAATSLADALRGLDVARSMTFQILGQVSELGDISDRISGVVDSIRTIAGQTNLLALNATIEAARAGDAGRGFAVVAAEVRKLAQDARAATVSIDTIVGEVRDISEATIEVANGAGEEVERARGVCTGAEGSMRSVAEAVSGFAAELAGARGSVAGLVQELTDIRSGAPI